MKQAEIIYRQTAEAWDRVEYQSIRYQYPFDSQQGRHITLRLETHQIQRAEEMNAGRKRKIRTRNDEELSEEEMIQHSQMELDSMRRDSCIHLQPFQAVEEKS